MQILTCIIECGAGLRKGVGHHEGLRDEATPDRYRYNSRVRVFICAQHLFDDEGAGGPGPGLIPHSIATLLWYGVENNIFYSDLLGFGQEAHGCVRFLEHCICNLVGGIGATPQNVIDFTGLGP